MRYILLHRITHKFIIQRQRNIVETPKKKASQANSMNLISDWLKSAARVKAILYLSCTLHHLSIEQLVLISNEAQHNEESQFFYSLQRNKAQVLIFYLVRNARKAQVVKFVSFHNAIKRKKHSF